MTSLADLPQKHFGAILADPPWRFKTWSARGRDRCPDAPVTNQFGYDVRGRNNSPLRHYHTMSLEDIAALPVGDLAGRDCVLFLWAVDPLIPRAIEIGQRWGFTYKTVGFYWAKTRRAGSKRGERFADDPVRKAFPMGTGYWTRANPETCLLFARGAPKRMSAGEAKLIVSPRREHSRKPDESRERIERLVAGPYLELFARESRHGWTTWGDEASKFGEYDGQKDLPRSIEEGFAHIRQRVANGGPGWQRKESA